MDNNEGRMTGGRITGTLGKAMDVLNTVADADHALRFTDLLSLIPQPRGTLHRQISNLIEEGLLSHRNDGAYELGPQLLRLASRAWSGNQFRTIAEPHLRALHEQTGETVHLGILAGNEVIYLDKVESKSTVRMHSQVGKASPLYCTGVGKAALSTLSSQSAAPIIHSQPFYQHTATTLASPEKLTNELDNIRASGIAYDREEHELGIHCVAAAIAPRDGSLAAGLSVTAPVYRVPSQKLEQWAPLVQQAARAITDDIEIRMGPRS